MNFICIGNLYTYALVSISINWVVFIHASGVFGNERTETYYDLTGSLTYLSVLSLAAFHSYEAQGFLTTKQMVLSAFVAVWVSSLLTHIADLLAIRQMLPHHIHLHITIYLYIFLYISINSYIYMYIYIYIYIYIYLLYYIYV
jgi:hypothetical protein